MDRIGLEHRLELALGVYCIFNVSGAATITIDCLVDLVHELLLDELSKRVVRSRLDGFLKEYYPGASLFSAHVVPAALHLTSSGEASVSVDAWNSLYLRAFHRALVDHYRLTAYQSDAPPDSKRHCSDTSLVSRTHTELNADVLGILDPSRGKFYKHVDYAKMDHDAIVETVHLRDEQVRLLRTTLFAERRKTARLTEKLNNPDHAIVAKNNTDENSVFAIVQANSRSLAPPGMVALAVRRNASNIAACRLGSILLRDMSHQTVVKAELATDAAINDDGRIPC